MENVIPFDLIVQWFHQQGAPVAGRQLNNEINWQIISCYETVSSTTKQNKNPNLNQNDQEEE